MGGRACCVGGREAGRHAARQRCLSLGALLAGTNSRLLQTQTLAAQQELVGGGDVGSAIRRRAGTQPVAQHFTEEQARCEGAWMAWRACLAVQASCAQPPTVPRTLHATTPAKKQVWATLLQVGLGLQHLHHAHIMHRWGRWAVGLMLVHACLAALACRRRAAAQQPAPAQRSAQAHTPPPLRPLGAGTSSPPTFW